MTSTSIFGGSANTTLPVINVRDYGAVGDGSTDDSTAFANAIAAAATRGQIIYMPGGSYYLAAPVSSTKFNLEFWGQGGIGESPDLGDPVGTTEIRVASGITGLTLGGGASTNQRRGPVFRNIVFRAHSSPAGSSTVGLKLYGASNARFENVGFVGFNGTSCIGLHSQGISSGGPNYLNHFYGCHFVDCTIGVTLQDCTAHYFFGGYFRGNSTGTSITAGRIGINGIASGGTHKVISTNFQYWEKAVFWDDPLDTCETNHVRFEGNTTCLSIEADRCVESGSTFSNLVIGGTGTAIDVAATSTGADLRPGPITDFGTVIADAGTQTRIQYNNPPTSGLHVVYPTVANVAQIKMGTQGIFVCSGTPEGQITAPVGSLALRSNGGANTTLYIKESGAGNTGWVAK